jgi:hypothetical protein
MQTVTRETPYQSRRAFCCGLGAALALPMVDLSVLAQAPAAQEAAGPPMLPLRSPASSILASRFPILKQQRNSTDAFSVRSCFGNGRHRRAIT